jgi:V8-like Glu-specific endopeptidase
VRGFEGLERVHREVRRRSLLVRGERGDPAFADVGISSLIETEMRLGYALYGSDGRKDPTPNMRPLLKRNIAATVAMIPRERLKLDGDVFRLIESPTLAECGICETDRFSNQRSAASYTASLVGPNIVATAGHCCKLKNDAGRYLYVLDFQVDKNGKTPTIFKRELVHEAAGVIARSNDAPHDQLGEDWILISLDGDLIHREIPPARASGRIASGEEVYMLGFPRGIPLKYSPGAFVQNNNEDRFFVANLDGFEFESGAPVFSARTDELEGIYVRGEIDMVSQCGCLTAVRCTNQGCRGEDVTRITKVHLSQ